MRRRIALFANGKAGEEVASFLSSEDEVVVLFTSNQSPEVDRAIESALIGQSRPVVFVGDLRSDLYYFVEVFKKLKVDTIITVYWPFLIPIQILELCDLTVNFHPALLPLNRGWYPHVHNILDGSPAGVTLHELTEGIDAGGIWAQELVEVLPWDCAGDLYLRLQQTIIQLFKVNWPLIKGGLIKARKQDLKKSSYHSKSEIDTLDLIDLDGVTTAREVIRHLRARTFGDRGYAYFEEDGKLISIRIVLEEKRL